MAYAKYSFTITNSLVCGRRKVVVWGGGGRNGDKGGKVRRDQGEKWLEDRKERGEMEARGGEKWRERWPTGRKGRGEE